MTFAERVEQMLAAFEVATRDDGSTYWRVKEGSPDWMQDVCRKAHDDAEILPDDWRYKFIYEALSAMDYEEDIEAAIDNIEPDIYTHELTGWLHSSLVRSGYCDDALREWGPESIKYNDGLEYDTLRLLQLGQLEEKREVFCQVKRAIEEFGGR